MRVIAHVDMDAFYTQVEVRRDLDRLSGQPVVVIQYNPFGDLSTLRPEDDRIKPDSNGSIIAVGYEARAFGVKRNMMAQQAKKLCPSLQIVQVPVAHGKADLTIYRDAGAAVINVLSKFGVCERASIDEAYLDVTAAAQQLLADARKGAVTTGSNIGAATTAAAAAAAAAAGPDEAGFEHQGEHSAQLSGLQDLAVPLPDSFEGWHVAGVEPEGPEAVQGWWLRPVSSWSPSDALLAAGACVVARARAAVKASLGFSCSAGIAHSKILAKLGSGLHKPAQQTLVPAEAVAGLLAPLPVAKLRQLGGKFGEEIVIKLGVSTVGDLAALPVQRLEAVLGTQDAAWLHRLAQGLDGEVVKPRKLPQSISCGKTFRGHNVLTGLTAVHTWLLQLAQELQERIEADRQQHQRLPKLLTVSFDSAPVEDASAAAPGAAAAAAATATGSGCSGSNSSESGPVHARLTTQNWRAGATNISRSCALRHARADAIATDALGLVKKWARDRPNGFRIVTMFISASNFSLAPTGASTLARFFATPAAAAAAGGAAAAPAAGDGQAAADMLGVAVASRDVAAAAAAAGDGVTAGVHPHPSMLVAHTQQGQPQQQWQEPSVLSGGGHCPAQNSSSTPVQLNGSKRAAAHMQNHRQTKVARVQQQQQQQGSLAAFLAANQRVRADHSSRECDAGGDNRSEEQLQDVLVIESSQDMFAGVDGVDDGSCDNQCVLNAGMAGAAAAHACAAAAAGDSLTAPAADTAAVGDAMRPLPRVSVGTHLSPLRPAVSAMQALGPQPVGSAGLLTSASGDLSAAGDKHGQCPVWPLAGAGLVARPSHTLGAAAAAASAAAIGQRAAPAVAAAARNDSVLLQPPHCSAEESTQHTQELQPSLQGWLSGMQHSADGLQLPAQPAEQPQDQHSPLHVQESVMQQEGQQLPEEQGAGAEPCMLQQQPQQEQQQEEKQQEEKQQLALQDMSWQHVQEQDGQQLHVQAAHGQQQQQQHGRAAHGQQQQHGQAPHAHEQHVQGQPGAVSDPMPVQPLRLSDIDPDVLAALPWDIQVEVRSQLRVPRGPVQTSSSGRRGGGGRVGSAGGRRQQGHGSIFKYLKR